MCSLSLRQDCPSVVRKIEPKDRLHNGIHALACLRRVTFVAVIHVHNYGNPLHVLHLLSLMIHNGSSWSCTVSSQNERADTRNGSTLRPGASTGVCPFVKALKAGWPKAYGYIVFEVVEQPVALPKDYDPHADAVAEVSLANLIAPSVSWSVWNEGVRIQRRPMPHIPTPNVLCTWKWQVRENGLADYKVALHPLGKRRRPPKTGSPRNVVLSQHTSGPLVIF